MNPRPAARRQLGCRNNLSEMNRLHALKEEVSNTVPRKLRGPLRWPEAWPFVVQTAGLAAGMSSPAFLVYLRPSS